MKYVSLTLLLCLSAVADPEEIVTRLKQDLYASSMFKTHFDRMKEDYKPANYETNKLYKFFVQKGKEVEEGTWDATVDRKKVAEWYTVLREMQEFKDQYKNVIGAAQGLQQAIMMYQEDKDKKEELSRAVECFNKSQLQLRACQGKKYNETCVERGYVTPFLGHSIELVKKWHEANVGFKLEDPTVVNDVFAGKILQYQLVQEMRDLAKTICPILAKDEPDEEENVVLELVEAGFPDLKKSYDVNYKPWAKIGTSNNSSNWRAQYHNESTPQFTVAQSQFPTMKLQGKERVLDIGCGTGRATSLCAQQYVPQGSIVGIDSSDDMIEFAKEEYKDINNLEFQVADVSKLTFKQEFDVVYSFFCLHWLQEKQEQAIQNIARALKPGGSAYLYISIESDHMNVIRGCIGEIVEMHPEWGSSITLAHEEPKEEWIDRVTNAGLAIDDKHVMKKERTFENKEQCKEYLKALGVTTLSAQENEQFINLVIDKMYGRYKVKDDEPFTHQGNILILRLTKNQ